MIDAYTRYVTTSSVGEFVEVSTSPVFSHMKAFTITVGTTEQWEQLYVLKNVGVMIQTNTGVKTMVVSAFITRGTFCHYMNGTTISLPSFYTETICVGLDGHDVVLPPGTYELYIYIGGETFDLEMITLEYYFTFVVYGR
ncbi:MAG: hypothetical protein QXH20_02170 [Candidatus Bathyarchaeia archaeon]